MMPCIAKGSEAFRHVIWQGLCSVLLACVLAAAPSIQAAEGRGDREARNAFNKSRADRDDLTGALSARGEVRLIVGLHGPAPRDRRATDEEDARDRRMVEARQGGLLKRMERHAIRNVKRFRSHPFIAMTVDDAALDELLADPEVLSISEDRLSYPTLLDTPTMTRATLAWSAGFRGAGQVVAIIDTGVDKTHPFLAGKVVSEACFSHPGAGETSTCPGGVTQSTATGSGVACSFSGCDHGTHVAGIATGHDGILAATAGGMAPDAGLIAIQTFVANCSGSSCTLGAYDSDIALALERVYALRNTYNIASVNLSLGGGVSAGTCDGAAPAVTNVIGNLRAAGIATIVASGNNGSSTGISYPACISTAISVGSTTKQNGVSSFSNSGPNLKLLAPGSSILSSLPGGGYGVKSGTSMATPHVTGAWAVLKGAKPAASVDEILLALQGGGLPITDARNGLVRPLIQIGYSASAPGALGFLLGNANFPPAVSLTTPLNGASVVAPANINISAAASDIDGTVSKVEFYQGNVLLGTSTTGTAGAFSFAWQGVPAGTYNLTAKAYDNAGAVATSAAVTLNVLPPGTAINVGLAANGGVASVSSVFSGSYPAASINNGDRLGLNWANGGGWNDGTSGAFPDWAQIDFTGTQTIGEIDVFTVQDNYNAPVAPTTAMTFTQYGITAFQVQYWDGTAWTDVPGGNVTGNNRVWRQFIFTPVTTDRIRVLVNAGLSGYSRITEIEAWTSSAAANALPAVNLTSPATGTTLTAPGTVNLSATATDSDGTISKIEFYRGATLVATVNGSGTPFTATATDSGLSAGSYSYTAKAFDNNGGTRTSAAATVTVNAGVNLPPTVNLTSPTTGAVFTAPATISLSASASDSDGTISKVEFYRGTTLVATVAGSAATLTATATDSALAVGSYSYTAIAYDNGGAVTTSTAATVTVQGSGTGSAVNVALASNGSTVTASSTYAAGYAPAGVTNGDRRGLNWGNGGGWNDGTGTYPDWVQVNFSSTQTIGEIDVFTVQDNYSAPAAPTATMTFTRYGITAFQVQYWNGTAWDDVPGANVTGNNLVWRQFTFAPVTTDRIRVLVNASLGGFSRITEVEAWTVANAQPAVVLDSPATGAVLTAPGTVNLAATATDSDGTITKVEFYRGPTLLTTVTGNGSTLIASASDTGLAAGSYSYTAKAYDNSGGVTTSTAATVTVSNPNQAPTVSLTSPTSGSVVTAPGTVNLSATAADSDGTISKVEFYRGASLVATVTGSGAMFTATASDAGVPSGSYTYTARAYDNLNATGNSAAVQVIVNSAPSVSLVSPAAGTVFQAPGTVNLSATASDSDGTISRIEFYRDATLVATIQGSGASFAASAGDTGLAPGNYTYTARAYDNSGGLSISSPVTVTVNALPTVNLISPTSGAVLQAPGAVVLTATATDTDGAIAKVEFYRGAILVASIPGTGASFTANASEIGLPAGSYTYTAQAYDNAGGVVTSASAVVVVNAAPTIALISPTPAAVFAAPGVVNLSATAIDSDGTISKVEFYRGAVLVATVTGNVANFTAIAVDSGLPAGSYSYSAKAYDNGGAVTSTLPVAIVVNAAPMVSLTSPVAGAVLSAPGAVSLSASATDSDGTISKIDFYRGATLVASVAGSGSAFSATASDSGLASGSYTYTARAYDNSGAMTVSAAVQIVVNSAPAVSLNSPAQGVALVAPGTVSLSATASDGDGTISKIEFYRDTTMVALVAGSGSTFTAVASDTGLPSGSYSYTAKAYDNSGAATVSSAAIVVVSNPNVAPAISLNSPTAGALLIAPGTVNLSATATDNDGTINRIEFYRGGTLVASVAGSGASFTANASESGLPAGNYSYTARAYDNSGAVTTSVAAAVVVVNPNVAPTVTLGSPAAGASFNAPATVNLSATAVDTDGTISKVEFYRGATLVATVTGNGSTFTAVAGDSGLAAATYTYTAKAYDNAGGATVSAPTTITVQNAINVALASSGATATASSVYAAGYAPAGVINGDRRGLNWGNGGGWNDATGTYPDWVQVNFSGPQTIGEIDVFTVQDNFSAPAAPTTSMTFTQYGITAFQVQYWNGAAWVDVPGGNVTGNNKVWKQFIFSPVTTDRIRVLVNAALAGYSRITEIEAWTAAGSGNALPSISLNTPTTGTVLTAPGTVNLSATALDSDGTISKVEFYRDLALVASVTGGGSVFTATASDTGLPAANYTYTAKAYDNAGGVSTSSAAIVTVQGSGGGLNVALSSNGATATASSAYATGYSASGVINGDRRGLNWGNGGGWNDATGTYPDWVQVNFNGMQTIGEIDVFTVQDSYSAPAVPTPTMTFTQYGITAFQVQYWNGAAWVDVPGGNVTGNNLVWRQFTFAPVTTDRIRVLVNASLAGYSRITEVEAWTAP